MGFKKATKFEAKARIAIVGPAKSGKSYTSLLTARGIVGPRGRIAAIDTEHGSLSKYASLTDFDVEELSDFSPTEYIRCIRQAEAERYDALVIDSLSHAWAGKGGVLQMVDQAAGKGGEVNKFTAWRDPSALHWELVEAMHSARLHIVVTLRAKMAYVLEENDKGKKVPRKVGLQPIQRDELEYEFDLVGTLDASHMMHVGESRVGFGFQHIERPGIEFGEGIRAWLAGEKRPLVGMVGDLSGVDLRGASPSTLSRYIGALTSMLEGKHGPKADAARAHLAEVTRHYDDLVASTMDADRKRLDDNSYLEGGHDTGLSAGRTDTDDPSDDRASDAD